jgi:hypothetical protein
MDGSTPRVVRQALSLSALGAQLVADASSSTLPDLAGLGQVESSTDEP